MNKSLLQQTDEVRALALLRHARVELVIDNPFFAHLALSLKLVADPTLDVTTATDGYRLVYNPNLVAAMEPTDVITGVAHECMHVAFGHLERRGAREPIRWNTAGDFVINDHLRDHGFRLLKTDLFDRKYHGMTTEQVYEKLPNGKGQGGAGKGKGKHMHVYVAGKQHACGGLLPPHDKQGNKISTQAGLEEYERDMAAKLLKAAEAAKQQGKLPGFAAELVKEITEAKLPWQTILKDFIELTSLRSDYMMHKPNRRYAYMDVILPSLEGQGLGEIAVVFDTSCSIGKKELVEFLSEFNGILEQGNPEGVYLLQCDTRVTRADYYTAEDLPLQEFTMHGRGGTEFAPPFKWMEENGVEPRCLVYLTDGYGPTAIPPPEYPTLWVLTVPESQNKFEAPFGTVLHLVD